MFDSSIILNGMIFALPFLIHSPNWNRSRNVSSWFIVLGWYISWSLLIIVDIYINIFSSLLFPWISDFYKFINPLTILKLKCLSLQLRNNFLVLHSTVFMAKHPISGGKMIPAPYQHIKILKSYSEFNHQRGISWTISGFLKMRA